MTLREEIAQIEEDIEVAEDAITDANHTATQIEDLKDQVKELNLTVKALSGCNDTFELFHEIDQATGRAVVKEVDRLAESVQNLYLLHGQVLGEIFNLKAQQDPPELIPGLSPDVLNDMVEVFKVTVAKKKQELEKEA